MAKELAHFKNFAKLKDTSLEFNDITVLAGKPSTGKSYVMKFMYAVNETIANISSGKDKLLYTFIGNDKLQARLDAILNLNIIKFDDLFREYINVNNYTEAWDYLNKNIERIKNESIKDKDYLLLDIFKSTLKELSEKEKFSLKQSVEAKYHFILRNILESIFISIDEINNSFTFESKNKFKVNYSSKGLLVNNIRQNDIIENTIFVETPLIIEFEKFLPSERYNTPYHIDSLLQELNKSDYSFTSDESSNFIKSFRNKSMNIIRGNISKKSQGFLFESESGKNYSIVNVSSGIKSIGLLQYLVTNKALKKGSILFWEEPEVHLHPEWQLKMVDLFVELMNAGVKIVFSTHSPYMADYLNAISQKRGFRDRVSFNVLEEKDGIVSNYILDDNNWHILQKELMDTFEDILWQYL